MELFRIGLIPITWQDLIDISLLTITLFFILRWFYRSNLLSVALLMLFLILLQKVAGFIGLSATSFVLGNILFWLGIFLAVLLAPELRRWVYGLRPLGGLRLLRKDVFTEEKAENIAEEIVEALQLLSKNGLGALIVIEGQDDLSAFIQTGDSIQMPVEARMFLTIFEKKSPLHDGACIIRGDKIIAARCTLPLSDRLNLPQTYGQRHRAALGISEQSDALTLVVSEETGMLSIAYRGELKKAPIIEIRKRIVQFYLS
ncbi:MAG: diadenylate cyclase CdaA [Bacteroidia bacterium]|nr:diadenylate cyclase CdaA [Bacteroidia bacterium]MCX7764215.1 diadenylate cyclase CdaA [Bacteroidia bacterium]MDW8056891.1 diadenylate cyclase CdaA [Bacteroidia bacterium]